MNQDQTAVAIALAVREAKNPVRKHVLVLNYWKVLQSLWTILEWKAHASAYTYNKKDLSIFGYKRNRTD